MATRNDGETNAYTFQWKIKGISHCLLKTGEQIPSPTFIADGLKGTEWSFELYPRGEENEDRISFYIKRVKDSGGPDAIEVNYQLAILNKNGSILKEKTILNRVFKKRERYGFSEFEVREKVFVSEREAFLPEDTLTVQGKIWTKEETLVHPKYFCARTDFKENRRSFLWRIYKFSSLQHGLRKKFKDFLIDFDLLLNEELDFEKKMVLHINSFDESIKYFSIMISVADSNGKKGNCGIQEYFSNDLKKGVLSTRLFTDMALENKNLCLPIIVLYLDCEYVSLTTSLLYEYFDSAMISSKLSKEAVEGRDEYNRGKEKSVNTSVLINDLKSMYNYGLYSDMELRTTSRTFPVHKNILSARSPVFRRMLTNDMKEKNSGRVDIADIEDDIIHRMLLYMYTDSVEDLQFASASKLYAAADKYEILSLRSLCSSFMKDNLLPIKACEVLFLADQHQDVDLKCFVQDYIIEHDKEVFGLQEWKNFMDTNLKLAADIMYRKIYTRDA